MRSTSGTRRIIAPTGAPFDDGSPPDAAVTWHAWTEQPAQLYDWTCSACALEWVKRSTALILAPADIYQSRELTIHEIGYPSAINPMYGLMDASGSALREVLDDYGQESAQSFQLDFDTLYELAQGTTGMLSGAAWYHWVALRGVQAPDLWIANSAPGYMGVWDRLSRGDFERLGGFSVVWLV